MKRLSAERGLSVEGGLGSVAGARVSRQLLSAEEAAGVEARVFSSWRWRPRLSSFGPCLSFARLVLVRASSGRPASCLKNKW